MRSPLYISFVIITRNRKKLLLETIQKIYQLQTGPIEVIVVDNDSTDGTDAQLIKGAFGDAIYRRLDSNRGIGAWNVGFEMAGGEFIVILDDDSYPAFDVKAAVEEFRKDARLGLIAGNIINASTGNSEFSSDFLTKGIKDTHYYIGCGAIARKAVLSEVGYYDDRFFLYYNDNDLSARIIKRGFKIRFYKDFKFMHKGSQVYERRGERYYYEFRNLMWYLIKNFPSRYMARRLFKELRKNFRYALIRDDLRFYFKALLDTALCLPHLVKNRRPFTRDELYFVLGKTE